MKLNTIKTIYCEDSKRKVRAVFISDGWLCLHGVKTSTKNIKKLLRKE